MISVMEKFLWAKWDEDAALVLWAVNLFVSIPADDKTDFTQRANVSLEIEQCGLMKLINSLVFNKRIFFVLLMYSCRWVNIQSLSSVGYFINSSGFIWWPGRDCFNFSLIRKTYLSSRESISCMSKKLMVWHLWPLSRHNKKATFKERSFRGSSAALFWFQK